jgi:hypothetical protein
VLRLSEVAQERMRENVQALIRDVRGVPILHRYASDCTSYLAVRNGWFCVRATPMANNFSVGPCIVTGMKEMSMGSPLGLVGSSLHLGSMLIVVKGFACVAPRVSLKLLYLLKGQRIKQFHATLQHIRLRWSQRPVATGTACGVLRRASTRSLSFDRWPRRWSA